MVRSPPSNTTLECAKCQAKVTANGVGAYEVTRDEETREETQFGLFRCAHCGEPFLVRREGYPDRDDYGDFYTHYEAWNVLYPTPPRLGPEVPEHIAAGFREATGCFRAGANTATAIMCRRTIEAICKEKGAKKKTLKDMLGELRDAGLIAPQLVEWADELRDVGNDAAHEVEKFIPREDAQDVVEFTRAIIEYVYLFTDAVERFKKRRQARSAAPP